VLLFHEPARVAYDRLPAHEHGFDPAVRASPYARIVNRMSPSAFKRGHTQAILRVAWPMVSPVVGCPWQATPLRTT